MVCSPAVAPGPTFTLPVARSIPTFVGLLEYTSVISTTLVSKPSRAPNLSLVSTFTSLVPSFTNVLAAGFSTLMLL